MNPILAVLIGAEEHDPARSIHWLWPEPAELIYGTFASLLVFAVLFYFLRKPTKKFFADRTARIQSELDDAAADADAAKNEAAEIRAAAGDIDAERKRLFAEADAEAEQILTDGRAQLMREVEELEARADADIASSTGRVNDELGAEIARLSNRATETAIANGIVDDATQQELIEAFIAKVGQGATS